MESLSLRFALSTEILNISKERQSEHALERQYRIGVSRALFPDRKRDRAIEENAESHK
jgi:hypothetical protein